MPQLDPAPWFSTLALSWLTLLTIIPMKIMGFEYPNETSPRNAWKTNTCLWTWPWH
uniref:ATP synthase complex subunit 8 n=1 Tax=Paralichthyidae sp. TaxID=3075841 RepID=A0AA95Z6I4_9PLEU|nr:ATP synthase F0 subunit 8 [Citharichthys spilopterus]WNH37981.1 ATP synthase F0 subunit 8 [Paralichthyidae sp.]